MIVKPNMHRFSKYYLLETRLHCPYNYKKEGLISRLMSVNITKSDNLLTKRIVTFVESTIFFMLNSVDILNNWRKWTLHNR